MKILFLLFFLLPFFSHSSGLPYQVQLVSSLSQVQTEQTFLIGIKFDFKDKWHTYWSYPGDVGLPAEANWTAPKGVKISPLQWPTPERLTYSIQKKNIHSFVYKQEVIIPVQVTVSKNYPSKEVPIELKLTWFVCKDSCFSETDQLFLNLKVDKNYKIDKTYYPLFKQWEEKLPQLLSFETYFTTQGSKSFVHFNFDDEITCIDLFPKTELDFKTTPPRLIKQTERSCSFEVLRHHSSFSSSLQGLLVYKQQNKTLSSSFKAYEKNSFALIWFILLAFLGGLLLNVMPCVIPIIFLKLYNTLDLVKKDSKSILKLNLSYTAGVISSFLVLAFMILISKTSGEAIGWGFHMQSPLFVSFLVLLFLFMGFYLLNLVSIPMPKATLDFKSDQAPSYFLTGVLSTLAASPCTVPFMAPAVGFAFSRSYMEVFTIFFFLGLGLSFPYFIISFFPRLLKYLPQPSRWMEVFKASLSIPLFLVVMWLLYILYRQLTFSSFLITLLIIPLVILIVAFNYYLKKKSVRKFIIIACFILMGVSLSLQKSKSFSGLNRPTYIKQNFKPFSSREIYKLQKENKNVFVYIGAEWCLTCKWNEVFLKDKEVLQFFKENKVELFYGDWTYRNPKITNFLESYQRRGVPFYVFYRGTEKTTLLNSAFFNKNSFLKELRSALKLSP